MAQGLAEHDVATLHALAAAALPPGRALPAAGTRTVEATLAFVGGLTSTSLIAYRGLLRALDLTARLRFGHAFSALPLGRQLQVMDGWRDGEVRRLWLRALIAPLKLAHFDDPAVHAALQCRYAVDPPKPERKRWQAQVHDAGADGTDLDLDADVVVVGTGAGGAVVASELAEAGCAVVLLEEGPHVTRSAFNGRPSEMMRKLYRRGGVTITLGNTVIPVPVGRAVGGTTTVNAGTCLRVPERVLAGWRDELGLHEFTSEHLDAHYRKVEAVLGVAPSSPAAIGTPGKVIARGCEKLGWSHRPLPRNAPECDGQGLCCFGCPTDAKRSTNVSFVPRALQRGAELWTGVTVERVLLHGETATGVAGFATASDGRTVRVTVRAQAVVLACGALHTPNLLLRQGLCNASDQLGRNLSIHPAAAALALYREPIDSLRSVPQGYAVDQFHEDGILFEGATAPLDVTAATHTGYGPGFVATMEQFDRCLMFGFMISDQSRGRVRPGPSGEPLIAYVVGESDRAKIQRATGLLARLLFASGAEEVHLGVQGWPRLLGLSDVAAFERARPAVHHFDLTAWHPLGTARMAADPLRSVVGPTWETHDVHNLWICDGSSVPPGLGVNPQLTIMALAARAAGFVARRVERLHALAA
jgi:choline dehydrogenase-like flavoprotein